MTWNEVKENLITPSTWLRGMFMVIYAVIFAVVKIVIAIMVIFQFGSLLITGKLNERLLGLGHSMAVYAYQIFAFLLYHTDEKPFPLSAWPKSAPPQLQQISAEDK